jgi:hypothetical protein
VGQVVDRQDRVVPVRVALIVPMPAEGRRDARHGPVVDVQDARLEGDRPRQLQGRQGEEAEGQRVLRLQGGGVDVGVGEELGLLQQVDRHVVHVGPPDPPRVDPPLQRHVDVPGEAPKREPPVPGPIQDPRPGREQDPAIRPQGPKGLGQGPHHVAQTSLLDQGGHLRRNVQHPHGNGQTAQTNRLLTPSLALSSGGPSSPPGPVSARRATCPGTRSRRPSRSTPSPPDGC